MFAAVRAKLQESRLDLRRWWARERVTGLAFYLFAVRWIAWGIAAIIVLGDIVPEPNLQREPWLLVFTLGLSVTATLYPAFLRPGVRERLGPLLRRETDDLLVVGLIDMLLVLGVVYLSGGWDSPYYLLAVATLLVPSATLGLRSNLLLVLAFVAAYTLIVATAGAGTDGPWHDRELNNFAVFLTVPFIVAIVVQFFGWMSRQLAEQREAAQVALAENVRLQHEREELIALEERGRIAREIHDGIAQSIYILSLNLETAADAVREERGLADRLQRLVALSKQTLLEVRHYIFDLKPLLEGQAGVSAALRNQAREFSAVAGLPVAVDVVGNERALSAARSTALYRIAQEALSNVYRHANASCVSMQLAFQDGHVSLEVHDDGLGVASGLSRGRGLLNMQQRAADLHGTVTLESSPSCGTVVRAVLPLDGA